jgi:hypothetical protein
MPSEAMKYGNSVDVVQDHRHRIGREIMDIHTDPFKGLRDITDEFCIAIGGGTVCGVDAISIIVDNNGTHHGVVRCRDFGKDNGVAVISGPIRIMIRTEKA